MRSYVSQRGRQVKRNVLSFPDKILSFPAISHRASFNLFDLSPPGLHGACETQTA